MVQGDEDLVTPAEVSRRYFDALTAPRKAYIPLPRTGHDPNRPMLDAQLGVLRALRAEAMAADQVD